MKLASFIERWVCCGRTDDEDVVADLAMVRRNPDELSEQFIAYTHDPTEKHATVNPVTVWHMDGRRLVVPTKEETDAAMAAVERTMAFSTSPKQGAVGSSPDPETTTELVVWQAEVLEPEVGLFEDGQNVAEAACDGSDNGAEWEKVVEGPTSVFRICQDVIEVPRHRRLPHAKRGDYIASVVSEIKVKLGLPKANAANLLAVRRMANNIMSKHGVRPTHMRAVIEPIVAGVFIADEHDLRGAKMLASVGAAELSNEVDNAGPRNAWYDLFHPFKNRGASRVRGNV